MEMSERDDQLLLLMSDRAHIPAEIAKPCSGINDGDTVCVGKRDLKTRGVTAELLKAGITNWDGAANAIKF
jgi:hypothetical protein